MKKLAFTLLFSLCAIWAQSQSTPKFQWVKGGGSQSTATNSGLLEGCRWIGTDAHGNIYGASSIFYNNIQIDTSVRPHGFNADDFAVFSYRCDGSFRWARYFGNFYNDYPSGMFTDMNGNSYFAGVVLGDQYAPFNHYGDTTIMQPGITPIPAQIVAKIDSTGHTVWISFGAMSATTGYEFASVLPDNQGNVCVLTQFLGAITWGSFTIPSKGYYVLKFSPNTGTLIDVIKLDYTTNSGHGYTNFNFTIDSDNSYYLTDIIFDHDSIYIGSNPVIPNNDSLNTTVLIKFSSSGNLSWYKLLQGNGYIYQSKIFRGAPLAYGNNVYIGGVAQNNVNVFGSTINNPYISDPWINSPFIARFRKDNGNFVSLKHVYNTNYSYFIALASYSGGIIASGCYGQYFMYNLNDTLQPYVPSNTVYPFILSIDTALTNFNWGIATRVDDAYSRIESLTVDMSDNIYAGGRFCDSIYNSFGTGIKTHGGTSDFFIAKVAANNNCICVKSKPNPQLVSINNYILTVKGIATGAADSLVWIWGDGSKTKYLVQNTNVTHTYATGGNYNVCLRTYNYCGTKDSCFALNGVGITEQELKYLNAYPNPVSNSLTIENPYQCSMRLNIYTITGKLLYSNKYENYTTTIDMSGYERGVYFVEMILADGRRGMRKIVKE